MSRAFELTPVPPFCLQRTVWTLRRRGHNAVDRWDGTTYRRVLSLPAGPFEVAVTQTAPADAARLNVQVRGRSVTAAVRAAVKASLERLLGLHVDLSAFYALAQRDVRLGPLAAQFRGMKPPRYASVFEGVVNAMACQQVTLTLGIHLLNRLAVQYGRARDDGDAAVYAFPAPADLAELDPTDLRQLGFSLAKGRAIIELAGAVREGEVDLEALDLLPDSDVVQRLCALRGIGRWTAEYVLLRGLGRTHVFPGDDIGGRKNLQRWLQRTEPLDYDGVRRILTTWKPFGGLVYFHLLLERLEAAGELGHRP